MTSNKTQITCQSSLQDRLSDKTKAKPNFPPRPTQSPSIHALTWLNLQADEVIDACLGHLPGNDLAHLATAYRQGIAALAPPTSRGAQALGHRLADQCHRRLKGAHGSGPWIEQLVQASQVLDFDAQEWATMHARRQDLKPTLDVTHARFLAGHYAPHRAVPQDNTAAVLALDALSRGAAMLPLGQAQHFEAGNKFSPLPLKEAGAEALVWATFFAPSLQDTLIAHVIVGTALSFMGETRAAERWLNLGLLQNLDAWLDPSDGDASKTFYGPMRRHSTMPEESLAWLNAAALATGSTVLLASSEQARSRTNPSLAAFNMSHTRHPRWPLMTMMDTSTFDKADQALWARRHGFAALGQALAPT